MKLCPKWIPHFELLFSKRLISVLVGFLPSVKVRPMKRVKEEGDNALFYCYARGPQTLRFSWSRENGQPMSRRVSIAGKRLIIRGVKKEDEGTYLCTARNIYGSKISSAKLTVKGKICCFNCYFKENALETRSL